MSTRSSFFPYIFADEAVSIDVKELKLQGQQANHLIDREKAEIDLTAAPEWQVASIAVTAEFDAEQCTNLLANGESATEATRVVLKASCGPTRKRIGIDLRPSTEQSKWHGSLLLKAEECQGSLDFSVQVVRARTADSIIADRAVRLGARLASSINWRVFFDERDRIPGRMLPIEWKSFKSADDPRLKRRPDALYFLDITGGPKLLLNEDVDEDLRQILNSAATVGRPAAIRNVIFDLLESVVWLSLSSAAFNAVPRDGEDYEPPDAWQKAILKRFARAMFPDKTDDLAMREIAEHVRKPDLSSLLMERLSDVVEQEVEPTKAAMKFVNLPGSEQ